MTEQLFDDPRCRAVRQECGPSYPGWEADTDGRVYYHGVEEPGYILQGRVRVKGIQRSWLVCTAFHGPRPTGLFCLHWDDDPLNDSPGNLRWDTQDANSRDAIRNGRHEKANRTHCKYGHRYTPENTAIVTRPDGSTYRQCRTCRHRQTNRGGI
jgi:HNH endonuclease